MDIHKNNKSPVEDRITRFSNNKVITHIFDRCVGSEHCYCNKW